MDEKIPAGREKLEKQGYTVESCYVGHRARIFSSEK
jgi:hypothetical protein